MSPPPSVPPPPPSGDGPDDPGEGLDRDARIEAAASAHRVQRRDDIGYSPAFEDLDEAGRIEAFERASASRKLEAALDPEGRSTTVLAVLARIRSQS